MRYVNIILLILLLTIPIAFSNVMPRTGNDDYQTSDGQFNGLNDATTTSSVTLTRPTGISLVDDLDGDGIEEVIVLDQNNMIIYNTDSSLILQPQANLAVPGSTTDSNFSNIEIFDIDSDGMKEIVFALELTSPRLFMFNYNGTSKQLYNVSTQIIALGGGETDVIVRCAIAGECAASISKNVQMSASVKALNAVFFWKDGKSLTTAPYSIPGGVDSALCFPRVRTMEYSDYDNDGVSEYAVSFVAAKAGAADGATTVLYYNSSGTPTLDLSIEQTDIHDTGLVTGESCYTDSIDKLITPVTLARIDKNKPSHEQIIFGFQTSADEFRLDVCDVAGSCDDYPETDDGDGVLISNVFIADTFDNNYDREACVIGYNPDIPFSGFFQVTGTAYWLICISPSTSGFDTHEYSNNMLTNVSDAYGDHSIIAHSGQHISTTFSGFNPDEIITSFGVIQVSPSCTLGQCGSEVIFNNPIGDGSVIPADVAGSGLPDFLIMTQSNLFYLDDGFSNSPGTIDGYTVNPCLDSTWKQNTTLNVQITPLDVDGDFVSARATLFQGDPVRQQQSAWSANASSGTTFQFSEFVLNTTGTGTLRLEAQDVENNGVVDSLDFTFSIGANGLEFGDCITSASDLSSGVVQNVSTASTDLDVDNNAFKTAVDELDRQTGLGSLIIWIIIVFAAIIGLWTTKFINDHPNIGIGLSIVFLGFGFVIGALLGFISTGIVITFIILGILVVGVWFARFFTGVGNGTGGG